MLEPGLAGQPSVAFNLAILNALIGTPWLPDLADHVLIIEDLCEPLYRIDRMLFQMAHATQLRGIAGLRFGRISDVIPNDPPFAEDVAQVIERWCRERGVPWLGPADIGHDARQQGRAVRTDLTRFLRASFTQAPLCRPRAIQGEKMRHFILMTAAATMMLTGCTPAAAPRTMVIDDPLAEVAQRVEMLRVPEGAAPAARDVRREGRHGGAGAGDDLAFLAERHAARRLQRRAGGQGWDPDQCDRKVRTRHAEGSADRRPDRRERRAQYGRAAGDGEAVRAGLSQTPFDKAPIEVAAKAYMARHPDEVAALQARFKRSLMESGFR